VLTMLFVLPLSTCVFLISVLRAIICVSNRNADFFLVLEVGREIILCPWPWPWPWKMCPWPWP